MFPYLFALLMTIGLPLSVFAQFVERSESIEIAKGTRLCPKVSLEPSNGMRDSGKIFWQVTSNVRANGTQSVSAFVRESIYDRKSGDMKIRESRYDDEYAVLFKKDPARKGMLQIVSPEDGKVEATVETCPKRKSR
ncbi:MAG: hypothetical protein OJF52_000499 [Nitrospira sp.]|nr:MAG: hypothetical protein OJF52_000499 [Nitrospira sp.]